RPAHRMRSSRPRFNAIAARAWPSIGPTRSSMDRYVPDSDAEPAEPTFHVGRSRFPIRIAKSSLPHGTSHSPIGVITALQERTNDVAERERLAENNRVSVRPDPPAQGHDVPSDIPWRLECNVTPKVRCHEVPNSV